MNSPKASRRMVRLLGQVIVFAVVLCMVPPVAALDIDLPLDCESLGGCIVQNYFDHDPTAGFSDYRCGRLGYDGHKGTDFRLPNLAAMQSGVPVQAAAAGRVRAIRDEMPDISIREAGQLAQILGREAGNAVAIRHDDDWETQYSHLRRGSVKVRPGQWVRAGQVLGMVGLSGKTEFPHVHFEVRFRGRAVDPFVGPASDYLCGGEADVLWRKDALGWLDYRPAGLIQAGFSARRPEIDAVEAGRDRATILDDRAEALVFWVEVFGVRQGDEQRMTIVDPLGDVLIEKTQVLAKNQARWFSFIGKRRRAAAWVSGTYRGEYRLYRDGVDSQPLFTVKRDLQVRLVSVD